ncbi:hypothetical protein [Pseudoprimorskyibacter insulae]|uniref:Uncharacterized protein n=1 Tax=Pseudoprimorskyibacter insulae TaxID=1695997 RepID=A0A2R8AYT3_9RHOB|nr:hypothetical protein [Pseudoprimorskyibacter insulae]SPF81117.1 hypothetical protein PRI8871_02935 [Pseudoprimorskyibacter insulae]
MIHRSVSAGIRACLVATLISMPAILVPGVDADTTQIVALLALLAGVLTFVEYNSTYPSIIDFRSAPPLNRLRFGTLFVTVFAMTQLQVGSGSPVYGSVQAVAQAFGTVLDIPFSPVRLALLSMPADMPQAAADDFRLYASLAYGVSIATIAIFAVLARALDWPLNNGAFNVLTNLPLFDPTTGGDVLSRMKRDTSINLILGFLLPFLIPAMVKLLSPVMDPLSYVTPQTLIWAICAWAFIPSSMFIRGIALWRISGLIEEKRRRAYAQQDDGDGLQAA